ncbi:MAG TPA: hypothetical protein VGK84_02830 [Candidatus Tumulicola sp.]|jgi:hypothetical protein
MSFIARWLDLRKQRRRVGLRPHGEVSIECTVPEAADRVRRAIADVLGAHVSHDDGASIEAAFGLVQSERIRISINAIDERRSDVRAEAIYPPGRPVPERSAAVDALLAALARD